MFDVDLDGKKVSAEVSFYTAQLYESEFSSDLVKDIFGSQRDGEGEFMFESVPVTKEDGTVERVTKIVGIDFTKVGWFEVVRALWAAVKTADPTTPGFAIWAKSTKGTNLWEAREKLVEEIDDCFFRSPAAGEEAQG